MDSFLGTWFFFLNSTNKYAKNIKYVYVLSKWQNELKNTIGSIISIIYISLDNNID